MDGFVEDARGIKVSPREGIMGDSYLVERLPDTC